MLKEPPASYEGALGAAADHATSPIAPTVYTAADLTYVQRLERVYEAARTYVAESFRGRSPADDARSRLTVGNPNHAAACARLDLRDAVEAIDPITKPASNS